MALALDPSVNPIAPVRASRDDNDQPSTAPATPLLPTITDRFAPRNINILLLPVIAFRALAAGLLSPQTISEESNPPGVRCWRQRGREGSGGVVADIARLSVGGRRITPVSWLPTTNSNCLGHGESPGRWYGAGATSLGLQGEASVAGFQRMFEGRHPDTGELLGRPHGRNAVPAFDVVLRPTKSVSILYGLGDTATGRAVLAAHHAGLAEAVAYLDQQLGARRGHGGAQHVSGQGLLAVGFDHRTSREGDPLLHTHLVIANRVQGPDGRWTALDGRDLYRHRLAADAIYRATYQRELVRTLGVEWTPADGHGNRELAGMSEQLVRSFSKRTDQIDAEVDRLVEDGRERTPRLVKWAVQATRKPNTTAALCGVVGVVASDCDERAPGVGAATATSPGPGWDQAPAATPARPRAGGSPARSAAAARPLLRTQPPPAPTGTARARMTARKARATIASVTCRYHAG
jgi:conjugative relaxase-like TrwC/TraI family protein